ncbi:MAG: geranylgeranylglycerol-phosphate geranylgeranyltransferase, partial [Bacteroidota bacterium]
MMVLTLWLLRSFVLQKLFLPNNISFSANTNLYILLITSVVLIAAAGYMINDYFDVKTDSINHPETVVLDKIIKRRWAIILHLSFTTAGILLGVFVALKIGYLRLSLFHFISAFLLWFYSTRLKMKLLIGNIVVSLLTASVAFIPLVFEIGILQKQQPQFIFEHAQLILSALKITVIFSLFAFITSMAREIIKDIEDFNGDKASGGATMPIVWGIRTSKFNAFFLLIITALLLSFALYNTI